LFPSFLKNPAGNCTLASFPLSSTARTIHTPSFPLTQSCSRPGDRGFPPPPPITQPSFFRLRQRWGPQCLSLSSQRPFADTKSLHSSTFSFPKPRGVGLQDKSLFFFFVALVCQDGPHWLRITFPIPLCLTFFSLVPVVFFGFFSLYYCRKGHFPPRARASKVTPRGVAA